VSLARQRLCRGRDLNRGLAGDVSPAWGAHEGAGPLRGSASRNCERDFKYPPSPPYHTSCDPPRSINSRRRVILPPVDIDSLARETSVLNVWAVARQLYRRVTKFHHREKVSLSRQRRFFAPYQASLEPPPSIIWGRIVTLPPVSFNTFA